MKEIINSYKLGSIDKWQFIDAMYQVHQVLFEYAELLPETNISEISIADNKVVMTFRDSGIRFIVHEGDKRLAPFDTLNFQSYETDELQMQLNLIKNGQNILDIGANYGWYALHVASKHKDCKVFSFEPIPFTYNQLVNNIRLNNLNNILTFNVGFSDKPGSFSFFYDPLLSVNASLALVSQSETITEVKCNVDTLDNWIDSNPHKIDFIKCDIEGAELLAFKGGYNTIKNHRPVVFTEMLRKWTAKFDYSPNDIISLFRRLGYECFTASNQRLVPFDHVDENTKETNYFFLHLSAHKDLLTDYEV